MSGICNTIPTNGALAYLATPYSKFKGGPGEAFIAACRLAAQLLRAGVKVYSPIAHTHPIAVWGDIDPLDHAIWLPFDVAMMTAADVLIVAHMDGWEDSYGIAEEVAFFERAGKPIFDLDPVTLSMTKRKLHRPVRDRYEGASEEDLHQQTNLYLDGHK